MDVLAALRAEPAVAGVPAGRPEVPVDKGRADPPAAKRRRRSAPQAPPASPTVERPLARAAEQPRPVRTPVVEAAPVRAPAAAPERPEAPVAPRTRNTHVDFRTRRGAQRLAGALVLVTLPATAAVGWLAYDQQDPTYAGMALILATLTLGLWFLRVMTVPVSVSAVGPMLEVRQGDRRLAWDLSSQYSPVDHVRSRPGRSGWRVIMRNPDGTTFAIDSGMVPADTFMELLRRYRPEL
jgi:hypothetical protein